MDTLTIMNGCARLKEAIIAAFALLAFAILLTAAYHAITNHAASTQAATTLQWASDTASWKGGW